MTNASVEGRRGGEAKGKGGGGEEWRWRVHGDGWDQPLKEIGGMFVCCGIIECGEVKVHSKGIISNTYVELSLQVCFLTL